MIQYDSWPSDEVETKLSAKQLCAGSIPASASNILKSTDFVFYSYNN